MSYDHYKTRSDRDEDERYGRTPEPEPEEEEEWEFYSGPFVSLESAIAAVAYLNAIHLSDRYDHQCWKFGVWPDPATATKWIIKRTWR